MLVVALLFAYTAFICIIGPAALLYNVAVVLPMVWFPVVWWLGGWWATACLSALWWLVSWLAPPWMPIPFVAWVPIGVWPTVIVWSAKAGFLSVFVHVAVLPLLGAAIAYVQFPYAAPPVGGAHGHRVTRDLLLALLNLHTFPLPPPGHEVGRLVVAS